VVFDTKESNVYDGIASGCPIFSPDSTRVAFAASENSKWRVVVGTQEYKPGEMVGKDSLVFSPDGKHAAWTELRNRKWFILVDGQDAKDFDTILRNSKLTFDGPNTFHALAENSFEVFRVNITVR
jgi:hypothetical protein